MDRNYPPVGSNSSDAPPPGGAIAVRIPKPPATSIEMISKANDTIFGLTFFIVVSFLYFDSRLNTKNDYI